MQTQALSIVAIKKNWDGHSFRTLFSKVSKISLFFESAVSWLLTFIFLILILHWYLWNPTSNTRMIFHNFLINLSIFCIILQVAVEYDCSDHGSLGPINFGYDYCVHVLARHPTLSQEKVDKVIAFAGNFFFISVARWERKKCSTYLPLWKAVQ